MLERRLPLIIDEEILTRLSDGLGDDTVDTSVSGVHNGRMQHSSFSGRETPMDAPSAFAALGQVDRLLSILNSHLDTEVFRERLSRLSFSDTFWWKSRITDAPHHEIGHAP
ncbi:hypothetical protein [Streptomyces sp. SMS_SU21]|uniref:hypothetical protein n=1 Tax=Streptomyces sp. SMS_SU21 TaxID=2069440 RepID=UPI001CDA120D|nr:hypothetical protein [Streptomyces sp. SMS_SU21]MCA2203113.1 hypothetical protein [Streptomyces sp. SMS_SU21]